MRYITIYNICSYLYQKISTGLFKPKHNMSNLQQFINRIPSFSIQEKIIKCIYWIKGISIDSIEKREEERFYTYKDGDFYFLSEVLSFFRTKKVMQNELTRITTRFYTPTEGDTIIDIGAGMGEEATVLSELVGPSGQIIAIEANPGVAQELQRIIKLNKMNNITVLNIALNDRDAVITLEDNDESYISGNTSGTSIKTNVFQVAGKNINSIINEIDTNEINLIKVNIEGAERFLTEITDDNFNKVRNWCISCHDFRYDIEKIDFFKTKQIIKDFFHARNVKTNQQNTGVKFIDDCIYAAN